MTPFPGVIERSTKNGHPYVLNQEQREWLIHWFPTIEDKRIAQAMNVSLSTMHRLARDCNVKKSAAGMKAIKRRQAKAVYKLCKKNGYYDSIRGKTPSDATREATRKMWEEVRAGRRDHPAVIMRKKDPKKYKQWMQRKSETRKETIRKERLRLMYGLSRKTNIPKIILYPYTRSQIGHRFNALRRGYLVAEDCSEGSPDRYVIFYDKDTQRSEAFEQNCKNDGFRIESI